MIDGTCEECGSQLTDGVVLVRHYSTYEYGQPISDCDLVPVPPLPDEARLCSKQCLGAWKTRKNHPL